MIATFRKVGQQHDSNIDKIFFVTFLRLALWKICFTYEVSFVLALGVTFHANLDVLKSTTLEYKQPL